jgi:hypothetical protein
MKHTLALAVTTPQTTQVLLWNYHDHMVAALETLEPPWFYDVPDRRLQLDFTLPRYGVSPVGIHWRP